MEWLHIFVLIAGLTGPGDTTKYYLYETENVNAYSQSYSFTYPALTGRKNRPTRFSSSRWMEENNFEPRPGDTTKISMEMPAKLKEWMDYITEPGDGDIQGFRVQIYAGPDLEEADKMRSEFLGFFPKSSAEREWDRPTFRVRAGNFIDRKSATVFCNEVRRFFPGAFVVPDMIPRPSFRARQPVMEQDSIITFPPQEDQEDMSPR